MATYLFAFAAEIIGIVLILWDGIPIFRHLLQFELVGSERDLTILIVATILVQFSYWRYLRYDPPFELPRQQFLAHIVLFISRLVFIFPSAIFSLVVYRYPNVSDVSITRLALMMAVLFSGFCFSRHLEKLGTLMNRT